MRLILLTFDLGELKILNKKESALFLWKRKEKYETERI